MYAACRPNYPVSGLPCNCVAQYLQVRECEVGGGVSGGIQDEDKTVDIPNQLTVTMFYIIVTQLLELQIPVFLIVLVLGTEIETNFVEPPFSFRIHYAIFEVRTLPIDPSSQLWVKAVACWHSTCKAGRETGGVLVAIKMKQNGRQPKTTHSDHVFHSSPAVS
jgi:hypothetical protein